MRKLLMLLAALALLAGVALAADECQDIAASNVDASVTFDTPGCLIAYQMGSTTAYVRLDADVAATTDDTPLWGTEGAAFGTCIKASRFAHAITASGTTTVRVCSYRQ
jgi:hypothetical protein